MTIKYTEQMLRDAVSTNTTMSGVLRQIGANVGSGTMNDHIRKRIERLGISIEHFVGKSHRKGVISEQRLDAKQIVARRVAYRKPPHQLRRVLAQNGAPEQCANCSLPPIWQGRPLVLQIDHIDGDWQNNAVSNLRYLCPNCHTQTETHGR